jgi:hypothetical protein
MASNGLGMPFSSDVPRCRMGEVLPCISRPARTTLPPNTSPMHWWPRHTPNTGTRVAMCFITAHETPASCGEHGPG